MSRQRTALVVLAAFFLALFSDRLLNLVVPYGATVNELPRVWRWLEDPIRQGVFIALGLLALGLAPRTWARELGLDRGLGAGLAFGLLATLPMAIGFAATGALNPEIDPLFLVFSVVVWSLAEEIVFRGFGFGLLRRCAGWGFWPAALATAAVFGLGHLYNVAVRDTAVMEAVGVVAITGIGGILFAWIYERWDTLWAPYAVHAAMNLWWIVFAVDEHALGGWAANAFRLVAVIVVIAWTARRPRSARWAGAAPA